MKLLIAALIAAMPYLASANVADETCTINGTKASFDLASSTPWDEGSRFFAGLDLSTKGQATADISIKPNDARYQVDYADGVLDDGAGYFRLNVVDRKTNAQLYIFSREKSAQNAGYSHVESSLPGLTVKNGQITCQD